MPMCRLMRRFILRHTTKAWDINLRSHWNRRRGRRRDGRAARYQESTRQVLISELGRHARASQDIASSLDQQTGWTYMGLDLSPAPRKEVSIASATAGFTGGRFGTSGTMTAAATITSALRDIAVTKVGYSGLMMPVMEDTRLSQLWSEGAISMDQLLAYSAVCGTGLDTIPLPGDVTTEQLERIIGDVASLSVKWSKPLSARLLPVRVPSLATGRPSMIRIW